MFPPPQTRRQFSAYGKAVEVQLYHDFLIHTIKVVTSEITETQPNLNHQIIILKVLWGFILVLTHLSSLKWNQPQAQLKQFTYELIHNVKPLTGNRISKMLLDKQ